MERLIRLGSREKKDGIAFDSTELVNDVPNAELSTSQNIQCITSKTPLNYWHNIRKNVGKARAIEGTFLISYLLSYTNLTIIKP